MGRAKEAKRTDWINFLRAERCGPCDFGGIRWNFLRGGKMLLNGARGLPEPQASCPECRFAFKHFFSPLEVPGFWNGARNIPLHSQNTILQILRSIPDTLLKPLSELNSGTVTYFATGYGLCYSIRVSTGVSS